MVDPVAEEEEDMAELENLYDGNGAPLSMQVIVKVTSNSLIHPQSHGCDPEYDWRSNRRLILRPANSTLSYRNGTCVLGILANPSHRPTHLTLVGGIQHFSR